MKVTYNWLKDFVEIKIPAGKLADKLTMAGLEVASLEEKDGDFVFEIEVTSNRPDCLSVLGVAREVAAITGRKMNIGAGCRVQGVRSLNKLQAPSSKIQALQIKVENKNDCPLYIARIIRNLKVGPSPTWLKKRLELVGCRSINNVVDITNYVLFELGEPLHAFDLDKLVRRFAGSQVLPLGIIIRRAKNREEIITIDGVKRVLDEKILVIASGLDEPTNLRTHKLTNQAIAIAGIMGGTDTEVTEKTKDVLLEAAVFDPIRVRRARQQLGLQSESAYRFERGIDGGIVERASRRAAQLLTELAGGECVLVKSCGQPDLKKNRVSLNIPRSNKILGMNIMAAGTKKILRGLGFKTKTKGKSNISITVPSYRQDVLAEIDLIEELARIYGFDKIPTTLPSLRPSIIPDKNRELVSAVKNALIGLGLNEVITCSLVDKALLRKEAVGILNPLSKEQEFLRPQIIPSLVACISRNLNYKQEQVNIFEAAKVFCPGAAGMKEELLLGIALCGTRPYISEQGVIREKFGLLHLKGILEALIERMGVTGCDFVQESPSVIGIYAGTARIGEMESLKEIAAAEISLEKLFLHVKTGKVFKPLPKYPEITRDISLVFREDTPIAQVLQAAWEKGRPLLHQAKVTDYYKGKQIPEGNIGLTISCIYRSDERTLSESEVSPVHNLICSLLEQSFGARLR